ncbi:TonB dependent receptor [compost metagenome]
MGLDASVFYTHFNNRIIGDFDTHPDQIIYQNLNGYAVSKGLTFNMELSHSSGFKGMAGVTFQDVSYINGSVKQQQVLTESFSGTWTLSYKFNLLNLTLDYTGNLYGPMQLPLAGKLDPRSRISPWWSIQNIQLSYELGKRFSIYGGIKNLLNFTPDRHTSFLIARANDPFDKKVEYDAVGQIKATAANPYALTFDPNYIYAPNQGRRGVVGIRMTIHRSGSDD